MPEERTGWSLSGAGTEDGELGVVPRGNDGEARQGGNAHGCRRFRREDADGLPRVHRGGEEAAAQAEAAQNDGGEISRFQVRELGGSGHGPGPSP